MPARKTPALIALAAALGAALGASSAVAQDTPLARFQKAEDAIKYRQSAFTLLAAHFGPVAGMAGGKIPYDPQAAAAHAALAARVAPLAFAGFGPGTDAGRPHRAKPEVWKDDARFKAAARDMVAAMARLDEVARAGELDKLKPAVGAVGKTCKGCHDDFRAEQYSAN